MDRLDSAQNTPQDAEKIDEEILADNDPSTEDGAVDEDGTFNAQPQVVPDDRAPEQPEQPRHSL
ncbi:MAG: hypothetical protein WCF36_21885 [Candidatus Nanopelagicales bacterium]